MREKNTKFKKIPKTVVRMKKKNRAEEKTATHCTRIMALYYSINIHENVTNIYIHSHIDIHTYIYIQKFTNQLFSTTADFLDLQNELV